ncbi:MAG: hypothetical protein ACLSVD_18000 [Eggerthellaceae bacterium]
MTSLVSDDESTPWPPGWPANKRAGTNGTLMNARCLYLPIRGKDTVVGVAGIVLADEDLDAFEKNLLLVMLDEVRPGRGARALGRGRAPHPPAGRAGEPAREPAAQHLA